MIKIKFFRHLKKGYIILTFIIGIFFIFIALSTIENITGFSTNDINSIFIGIGTGLLTTAITMSVIQYLLDIENEEKEKSKEKEELLRVHRILHLLIFKYIKYFYDITTPVRERKKEDWKNGMPIITDFDFRDIRDLYFPSLYVSDNFNVTSIELFYEAEEELREYMVKVISSNSLNYFVDMRNILLEFIECSLKNHHKGAILSHLKTVTGDKKTTEFILECFNDPPMDWLLAYQEGKLQDNMMLPFVMLYYFLKEEIGLIDKYNDEIKKIKNM